MAYADVAVRGSRAATGTPLLVVTLCLLGGGVAVDLVVGVANPFLPAVLVVSTLNACLGAAVARRRPGHPVARVLQASGAAGALVVVSGAHVDAVLAGALPAAGLAWSLWLNRWLWVLFAATPVGLLFAFPDGRLPSPRWRPVLVAALLLVVPLVVQDMAQPFTSTFWRPVPVTNPLGEGAAAFASAAGPWPSAALVAALALGAAAMLARRRAAEGQLRERLRWVAPVALLLPVGFGLSLLSPWGWTSALEMLAGIGFSVLVTVATFRHRMYDADVALNRAVVYGGLVAALISAYVGAVVVVSSAVHAVEWLPGAVGAAVVAVAFGPLLHLLRGRADQLLFGARRSPERVASRLLTVGAEDDDEAPPSDEELLARAAATLCRTLRLPWARLECGALQVTSGVPRTTGETLPLRRGGREVGRLVIGRRYDDERLRTDQPALVAAVAQLALTVDALHATAALRQARDDLLAARAEERRRIHRDLHDGLGPTLAGVCLGLEGTRQIATTDLAAAAACLPELETYARRAVDDVRRLVDGLRPVELDSTGLVETLRTRLAPLDRPTTGGPALDVRLPPAEALDGLPEDTETAALRICLEAVTNVVRHADATTCTVELRRETGALVVEVVDDGCGVAEAAPHVGLLSMRDRAREAGGRLEVTDRAGGGTCVRAVLPARRGGAR